MTEAGYDKSKVRRQVRFWTCVKLCYKALTWTKIKMGLPVTASPCAIQKMHKTFAVL